MFEKFIGRKFNSKSLQTDEKGMTLYETLIALALMAVLFVILMSIFSLTADKSVTIASDKAVVTGELNISEWIEKDFKENKVSSVVVTNDKNKQPTKIVFTVSAPIKVNNTNSLATNSTNSSTTPDLSSAESTSENEPFEITYLNKDDGFYRTTATNSTKLFSERVTSIVLDKNILKISYRLSDSVKTFKFMLDK